LLFSLLFTRGFALGVFDFALSARFFAMQAFFIALFFVLYLPTVLGFHA